MLKTQIKLRMLSSLEKATANLIDAQYQCFDQPDLISHKEALNQIKASINHLTHQIINDKNLKDEKAS